MAITGEIIQRVQSLYSKGAQSSSSRLMSRHIYNKLLTIRSLLFFQKKNKKQVLSKWNYSVIGCVALELINPSECPCIVSPGCQVLRSVNPLPKPLTSIGGYFIDSVTSVDGLVIFDEVTYLRKNWRKDDKYTSKKPDWFIKDEYLYITSTRKLKVVTVTGLFFDPIEVMEFDSMCGEEASECPQNPFDMDFPIDDELIDPLVELTVKELSAGFQLGYEDRRNDSVDKTEEKSGPRQQQATRQTRRQ